MALVAVAVEAVAAAADSAAAAVVAGDDVADFDPFEEQIVEKMERRWGPFVG